MRSNAAVSCLVFMGFLAYGLLTRDLNQGAHIASLVLNAVVAGITSAVLLHYWNKPLEEYFKDDS